PGRRPVRTPRSPGPGWPGADHAPHCSCCTYFRDRTNGMSACFPAIHEIPSLRVDPAPECRNRETIRIAGNPSWAGSCRRITVGYETVHCRRYTRPGYACTRDSPKSADKRTKPWTSEVEIG